MGKNRDITPSDHHILASSRGGSNVGDNHIYI
jgi:hypothetical protein